MSKVYKGGRGKKAPYEVTHHRIPANIKPLVSSLSNQYKIYVAKTGKLDLPENSLTSLDNFFESKNSGIHHLMQEIVAERDSYKIDSRNWKVLDKLKKRLEER